MLEPIFNQGENDTLVSAILILLQLVRDGGIILHEFLPWLLVADSIFLRAARVRGGQAPAPRRECRLFQGQSVIFCLKPFEHAHC